MADSTQSSFPKNKEYLLKDIIFFNDIDADWARKMLEILVEQNGATWSLDDPKFQQALDQFHIECTRKLGVTKEKEEEIVNTIEQGRVNELVEAHELAKKSKERRRAESMGRGLRRAGIGFSTEEQYATFIDLFEKRDAADAQESTSQAQYNKRAELNVRGLVNTLRQTLDEGETQEQFLQRQEREQDIAARVAHHEGQFTSWEPPKKQTKEEIRQEKETYEKAFKRLVAKEPDDGPVNPALFILSYEQVAAKYKNLTDDEIAKRAASDARKEELSIKGIPDGGGFAADTHIFSAIAERAGASADQKLFASRLDEQFNALTPVQKAATLTAAIKESLQALTDTEQSFAALTERVGGVAAGLIKEYVHNDLQTRQSPQQALGVVTDLVNGVVGGNVNPLLQKEMTDIFAADARQNLIIGKDGKIIVSDRAMFPEIWKHDESKIHHPPHYPHPVHYEKPKEPTIEAVAQKVEAATVHAHQPHNSVLELLHDGFHWIEKKIVRKAGIKAAEKTGFIVVWNSIKTGAKKAALWVAGKLGLKTLWAGVKKLAVKLGLNAVIGTVFTPVVGLVTTIISFAPEIIKFFKSAFTKIKEMFPSKYQAVEGGLLNAFGVRPAPKQKIPLWLWPLLIVLLPFASAFTGDIGVDIPGMPGGRTVFHKGLVVNTALLTDPRDITGRGLDESKYIGVELNPSTTQISCDAALPQTITYTVTITAKDVALNPIYVNVNANLVSSNGVTSLTVSGGGCPNSLAAGQTAKCTYSVQVNETNAQVIFTLSVSSPTPDDDPTGGVTAKSATTDVCEPSVGMGFRCQGIGDELWYPPAERQIIEEPKTGFCINPSIIVIHWSGGYANDDGNRLTRDTLISRGLTCQFATDTNDTYQMQYLWTGDEKGPQSELAWCVGGSYNNLALNNEVAGAYFDDSPDGNGRGHPTPDQFNRLMDNVCWMMDTFNIPASKIYGHFQLSPYKDDPGEGFLQEVINAAKGC